MLRQDATAFVDAGVRVEGAPYLGPVLMDSKGVVQWIHEERLLPASVRDLLFSSAHALTDAID
jgi:chemotaxis-related protein WspB